MNPFSKSVPCLIMALVVAFAASPAFADDATEARLREALRAATDQVQQLQSENASLQAQKALVPAAQPAPRDVVSRAAYSRAVARLNDQHQADQAEIAKLRAAVDEAGKQASSQEAARTKAEAALADAQERNKSLEEKNARLVEIGNDLLQRFQNLDWRDALGAKEPFVGTTRIELQNLAQDYGDKISDNKAGP